MSASLDKPEVLDTSRKLPVIELFGPTIQGEGALCGTVSHFIRLGGCSYRCIWCDSMHAVDPALVKQNATWMSAKDIAKAVSSELVSADKMWVTLSGGDPAIWDCGPIITALKLEGFKVAIETQGAYYRSWFDKLDHVTVSPKPPSSGMAPLLSHAVLTEYATQLQSRGISHCMKVVIFDEEDLDWAARLHGAYDMPFYLSAGTQSPTRGETLEKTREIILDQYLWLAEKVLKRPGLYDCIVLPQMHALLWGHKLGV